LAPHPRAPPPPHGNIRRKERAPPGAIRSSRNHAVRHGKCDPPAARRRLTEGPPVRRAGVQRAFCSVRSARSVQSSCFFVGSCENFASPGGCRLAGKSVTQSGQSRGRALPSPRQTPHASAQPVDMIENERGTVLRNVATGRGSRTTHACPWAGFALSWTQQGRYRRTGKEPGFSVPPRPQPRTNRKDWCASRTRPVTPGHHPGHRGCVAAPQGARATWAQA